MILNGSVLREKLSREIIISNRMIMWGEMIAMETKRTDPDLGGIIDNRKRVEYRSTVSTTKRSVREKRGRRG